MCATTATTIASMATIPMITTPPSPPPTKTIAVEWIQLPSLLTSHADAYVEAYERRRVEEARWLAELPAREAERIARYRDPVRRLESLVGWRRMMRNTAAAAVVVSHSSSSTSSGIRRDRGDAGGGSRPEAVVDAAWWSRDAMGRPQFCPRTDGGGGDSDSGGDGDEHLAANSTSDPDSDTTRRWEKSWFNVSHDGGCVAVAWDPQRRARLGVDVVQVNETQAESPASQSKVAAQWLQEMRGIFTANEYRRLVTTRSHAPSCTASEQAHAPAPAPARTPVLHSLLAYWAAKESYAKAMGCGLAIDPATIEVVWLDDDLDDDDPCNDHNDNTYNHNHDRNAHLRCSAHPTQLGITRVVSTLPGYLLAVTILVQESSALPQLELQLSQLQFDSLLPTMITPDIPSIHS